jgi:sulfatase modifying factor 1
MAYLTTLIRPDAFAGSRFYRISSYSNSVIGSIEPSGHVTWSNALPGVTCIVEVADTLTGTNGWRTYAQIEVTDTVVRTRLFDFDPPEDTALIPASWYQRGDSMEPPDGDETEQPVHMLYVSEFYMDRYFVTKAKWDEVYNWATNLPPSERYEFDNEGAAAETNHPVTVVSWFDIAKWCNARSEKEGLTPAYYTSESMTEVYRTGQVNISNSWVAWNSDGYRIPTEAEHEKAMRGGLIGRRFPNGDTISHFEAHFYSSSEPYDTSPTEGYSPEHQINMVPVGLFEPNGYGLYDMAGVCLQWNWDWFDPGWFTNAASRLPDTPGPDSGSFRMLRGGCWARGAFLLRNACRVGLGGFGPDTSNAYFSFRCVRRRGSN